MEFLSKMIWLEDSQIVFNLHKSAQWYPILYQIAFFSGLCVFIYHGIRKKYPLSSWLILSASAAFLLIVGSKLGTFSLEDWRLYFKTGTLLSTGKKTALGAAILIVLFFGVIVKGIRFKAPFWGAFAFFLPVIMLVQRAGCMMAGCCYGKPLASLGGIKYFGPSLIRDRQVHSELLSASESITLPVHNVPFYFMVVALSTILVLFLVRRWLVDGRQLLLVSLSCMLIGRFVVEFFRDLDAHNIQQRLFYGLTQQQWAFICVFLIFGFLFWLTTRKKHVRTIPVQTPIVFPMRNLTMLFALSIAIFALRDWFTTYEKYVLYFQMILAGLLNVNIIWTVEKQLKPLVAPSILFVATTLVIAQEATPDLGPSDYKGTTYITGSYSNNQLHGVGYPCIETNTGCSGLEYCSLADTVNVHGPSYSSLQLGLAHRIPSGKGASLTIGADFARESFSNGNSFWIGNSFHYNQFSTYFQVDLRRFGFTFGVRSGEYFNSNLVGNEGVSKFFRPRIGLRFGGNDSWFRSYIGVYDDYLPGGITQGPLVINSDFRLRSTSSTSIRPGFAFGMASYYISPVNFYGLNADIYFKKADLMVRPTFGVTSKRGQIGGREYLPQFALQFRKGFSHGKK